MAHIFISYSKKDIAFARHLRSLLQDRGFAVWMDDTKLVPSERWWPTIERNIVACNAFIVIMSPDSSESEWVEREILVAENRKHRKPIFPVLLSGESWTRLANIQYEDMTAGTATLTPEFVDALQRVVPAYAGETVPPPLPGEPIKAEAERFNAEEAQRATEFQRPAPRRRVDGRIVGVAIGVIALIAAVLIAVVPPLLSGRSTPTQAALQPTATLITASTQTIISPTPTIPTSPPSPSATVPTPTEAPTLDVVYIVQTLDAQGTAAARLTNIAATTAFVRGRTQTATLWTHTPTPTRTPTANITASIDAFRTQRAASVTAQHAANLTATATRWTRTPTPTLTPTLTDDQRAKIPVIRNADWKPIIRDFGGVKMALVPAGCFTMGTESGGDDDERPTTKICFDTPFWIDQTEVTNAQFTAFKGQAGQSSHWTDANRPRETMNWFEARDFCAKRGARLPTETEWEYVARGPDGLIYPWGNSFVADNVVYSGNSNNQTADVGNKMGGASWVGALDMSGNVREWVSSIYKPYPKDGRENNSDINNWRGLRGASWGNTDVNVRSAYRTWNGPTARNDFNGFRCARSG